MAKKLISGSNGSEWIDAGDVTAFDGALIAAGTGDDGVNGSAKSDELRGEDGNDQLFGNGGNDTLVGGAGRDTLYGGEGDDWIYDQFGNEATLVFAGNGYDRVETADGNDTIYGEGGGDYILAKVGNNVVDAGEGSDYVVTLDGNDSVNGGGGADEIWTFGGRDTVFGGDGSDLIRTGEGDDLIGGDAGNDTVEAGSGSNTVYGGAGDDVVRLDTGTQFVTGDEGSDTIVASNSGGQFYGGNGDDFIFVTGGAAFITGDQGNDSIFSGIDGNADTIYAGEGNDFVVLLGDVPDSMARDTVDGGNGYDVLRLSVGDDIYMSAAFGSQLAGLKASMAATPWQATNFATVGARISGFEKVEVETTLDFDAEALADGSEHPLTGYAGFAFQQTGLYNPVAGDSLGYVATSGSNIIFIGEADGIERDGYPNPAGSPMIMARGDGADFRLTKFFASAARDDGAVLHVEGYNNGVKVGMFDVVLHTGQAEQVDVADGLNFGAVDEVRFFAGSSYFGIDDVTVIV